MMSRLLSCVAALVLLVVAAPSAAQRATSDHDLLFRRDSVGLSTEDRQRFDELKEGEGQREAAKLARREMLLRLPPLPEERNVLLGSWHLEDGGLESALSGIGQKKGAGGTDAMFRDLWATLESNPDKLICGGVFGNGITFAPATYSIRALDGSSYGGRIEYRSSQEQVIEALPANWDDLPFRIAGPNRILYLGNCPLVRDGAPAANPARGGAPAANVASNAAAAPAMLAVGPDAGGYLCPDGRQLYVKSCYDELPDANCGIVNLHLPKRNGFQVETMDIRSKVMSSVAACKVHPVNFGDDGDVSLVK